LSDGDFGVINATTGVSVVPEPSTWVLTAFGDAVAAVARRKKSGRVLQHLRHSTKGTAGLLAVAACLLLSRAAFAQNLNAFTTPDNGVAGIDNVNVVGSGFPAGQITPANVLVTLSATCGGAASATANAASVQTIIGSARRINFVIPGTLATATYFVAVSDSGAGGDVTFDTRVVSCSQVIVTHTNPTLSACLPTSSLAVLSPTNPGTVTAYVPQGNYGGGSTGVQAVNLEGPTSRTSIGTPNIVNSCSSNPATGQTVCTANHTDVYLITGTTLNTTLQSSSNAFANFSGGSCNNCGVAINALSHQAVINMGLSTSPTSSGVQLRDLNTNTFSPPVAQTNGTVSEDISVDPTRGLILSPSENHNYALFQIQSDGVTLKEFDSSAATIHGPECRCDSDDHLHFLSRPQRGGGGAWLVPPGGSHRRVRRQLVRGASATVHQRQRNTDSSRLRSSPRYRLLQPAATGVPGTIRIPPRRIAVQTTERRTRCSPTPHRQAAWYGSILPRFSRRLAAERVWARTMSRQRTSRRVRRHST
jgi:hypothetical protein